MTPTQLEFPLRKAEYLFSYATEAGTGGDKQKFWRAIMGFESPEQIRATILAAVSVDLLQLQGQNEYGDRYQMTVTITDSSGVLRRIRTGWIVLTGENVARFVTAVPERLGR
ncbi:MAG: hypothetical protein KME42_26180 [Tildeniella nuda ZEHNDER 1965/U140]|jgi:hypothetical protein|nr:hypothetical protein [Tildeniella nuda ZEHNDER 1965/U140]